MKHSVSREDLLSSLSVSTDKSPSHPEAPASKKWGRKPGKGKDPERIVLHELQTKADAKPGASREEKMEKEVASSRNEQVGGGEERVSGSRMSLASSTWREEKLSRGNSSRSSRIFQVCAVT